MYILSVNKCVFFINFLTNIRNIFRVQENGRCVSKLENMGFRVGQGLIERQVNIECVFKYVCNYLVFFIV